jgi:hypothetical protein
MKLTEKLIYFFITILIILITMTQREDYVAFFNFDVKIKKNVELKNNIEVSVKGSIEGEKFCLNNSCISGEDIARINEIPEKLKTSICIDNECIGKKELYYLKDVWPEGSIVAYTGSISDIPEGWRICDGKDHLPDLRDRFILGSDSSGFGKKDGEKYVTLTENQIPEHYHFFYINDINMHNSDVTAVHKHNETLVSYKLQNGVNLGPTNTIGKSNSHNNMPPFYKVIYLIRVKNIDFILDLLRNQIKLNGGKPIV